MFTCKDLMAEIRDDDEMIDAYTPHWAFIKTRYESRHSKKTQDKKLYVIRASTPSIKYLAAILQLIHQEQRVAYKYNLQFSYILRNIETDELRLYYHGNNSRFHETPPLVEKDPDLDKEIEKYEAADIFESTIVQRPNTKWQLERIVGFAVHVYPIRGRMLGAKSVQLPEFLRNIQSVIGLVNNARTGEPYDDNLCLLRAIVLAKSIEANPTLSIKVLKKSWRRWQLSSLTGMN